MSGQASHVFPVYDSRECSYMVVIYGNHIWLLYMIIYGNSYVVAHIWYHMRLIIYG